jgi:K(+)-stimulated pyrophosphate-energized sodium pump
LVAGNFSAFWLGLTMMALMAIGYWVSGGFPPEIMKAAPVFAFGLVASDFWAWDRSPSRSIRTGR